MIYASKFKDLPYEIKFEVYMVYKELIGSRVGRELFESRNIDKLMNKDAKDLEKVFIEKKINFFELVRRIEDEKRTTKRTK